jgi:hypothetical protein
METTCEYCRKVFKNKYNLKIHISTSKSCLKIQNKQLENKFSCSICGKSYTRNYHLKNHKCKGEVNIVNNTTNNNTTNNNTTNNNTTNNNTTNNNTTNNNTTNNNTTININNTTINNTTIIKPTKVQVINGMAPLDLSEQTIRDIVERDFTRNYFEKNKDGVAQFIIDKILKRDQTGNYNYISVDGSRHIGVYKDSETGNIVKDHLYMKLAKPVYKQVEPKSRKIANEIMDAKNIPMEKRFVQAESKMHIKSFIHLQDEPPSRFRKVIASKTALVL